jgi:hypothetical protein
MPSEHEQLPYDDIIEALTTFVQEQRTGTMFIVTDSKHVARISLERGRIVSCTYTLFRGQDAIAHIRGIRFGAFSFSDGIFNSAGETPLPGTAELLRELGARVGSGDMSQTDFASGAGERNPAKTTDIPAGLEVSGDALWDLVVEELAADLGPVASIAAADYEAELRSATSGETVRAVLGRLASELPDSAQAKAFKLRVMARIFP